jgi:ribosomal protein S18 acetylase RimI-like enzyme
VIEYRKATVKDASDLTALRIKMLCEDNDYCAELVEKMRASAKDYFLQELANGNFIARLAVDGDKIIGACGMSLLAIPPDDRSITGKTAYISGMYVEPDYRRKGIAKNILLEIMEDARKENCERMVLDTTQSGKKLYEKYGFKLSPTVMAHYPFGIAAEKY